jgi:hypothetical protein
MRGHEDGESLSRLERSRRNLARLALDLRRRLHGSAAEHQALFEHADSLRDRYRECEQRAERLEQAAREMAADRASLAEAQASLHARVAKADQEMDERRRQCEDGIARKWDAFHEGCRQVRKGQVADAADPTELRRRELEQYAAQLKQQERRLQDQETELAWRAVQVAAEAQSLRQTRQEWEEERAARERECEATLKFLARQRRALAQNSQTLHDAGV